MKKLKILVFFGSLLFWSCNELEKEQMYERPEWLKGTLYEQLKNDLNHQIYVKALELTGYSDILSRTGSYTLFVPTDDAFSSFLGNYGGKIENVPPDLLKGIVEYSIIDYPITRDLLTTLSQWGYWEKSQNHAFKKKSFFIKPNYVEDGVMVTNQRKYFPIYSTEYFKSVGIAGSESATYEYLFPGVKWNVGGFQAHVVNSNILSIENPAENGLYYGIDKVISPLNNIAEELASNNNSSAMFNQFARFKEFIYDATATINTGSSVNLYSKKYNGVRPVELAASIADIDIDINEEAINSSYSPQAATYAAHTVFSPTNEKLNQHLAKYDGQPSRPALRHLLNNHFIKNTVQYPKNLTKDGSPHKYLFEQNLVTDKKVVSNGLIYYINDVLESNVFKGVTAPIFFKGKYSKYMFAIEKVDQTLQLSDGVSQYYLMAFDNATLTGMGIEYDESTDTFLKNGLRWAVSTNPKATSKDSVKLLVERHIAKGPLKGGFAKTLAGEFVEIDLAKNQIKSGDIVVPFSEKLTASNGTGYTLSMTKRLPVQQDNMLYLKASFPKFYNILIRAGYSTLYDEYTGFIIPDSKIIYGTAPFDMLKTDGTLNTAVTNAQLKLLAIVNDHLVTQTLFTTDPTVFGSVKTKSGKTIIFNGSNITDASGTVTIDSKVQNVAKASGVVFHLIDRVMVPQ